MAVATATKVPKFINNKFWPCVVHDRSGGRIKVLPNEVLEGAWWARYVNVKKGIVPLPPNQDRPAKHYDLDNRALMPMANELSRAERDQGTLMVQRLQEENDRLRRESDEQQRRNAAELTKLREQLNALSKKQGGETADDSDEEEGGDDTAQSYLDRTREEWIEYIVGNELKWNDGLGRGKLIGLAKFFGWTDALIEAQPNKKQLAEELTTWAIQQKNDSESETRNED